MRRRTFLASTAASLAAPRLARAASASTIRFTPEADLAVLDPVWTTASQSGQHAALIYDTLFGQDAEYKPQLQMLEGYAVEEDGRRWTMRLREGLAFHDGEKVLARDCAASVKRWSAREMQALAFQEVPYIPLGQMISPTAHRSDLVGMVPNQVAFWNVRRG